VTRDRLTLAALCAALVALGALAWLLSLRPALEPQAETLQELPRSIGGWVGSDIPLENNVESVLRADFNLQRAYQNSTGSIIWLYIGYYGTARGGRPEHTPRSCYASAGWGIARSRTLPVEGPLRVREMLVERPGQRRLVHYWLRSWRRTGMVSGFEQNLDRLRGRLGAGRADGALVRLSTPLEGDEEAARSRLIAFAIELDPLLAQRWPQEVASSR
jgi:EpsI family protein